MKKSDTTILLVAGHHRMGLWPVVHAKDTGACPKYSPNIKFNPPVYNEHHECEKLVTQAYHVLRSEDYTVWICPFTYDLPTKIKWCNKVSKPTDLVISVHMNGGGGTGSEVFYLAGNDHQKARAKKMAQIIAATQGTHDRGPKPDTSTGHGRLGIIRDTHAMSFLLEMGFIKNPEDMQRVREFGVQAIVDAVKSNF